jgi:hypothetical protein
MSAKEELHRLVDTLPEAQAARLLDELKLRSEIDHADEQLARGEFTDYDETTISGLAEAVKTRGCLRLAEERNKPVR